ncbi:MAG: hypothetical protein MZU97_12515 [Bacillus subtilis]|nr:hypothetical protein [Bacillus subtilis]
MGTLSLDRSTSTPGPDTPDRRARPALFLVAPGRSPAADRAPGGLRPGPPPKGGGTARRRGGPRLRRPQPRRSAGSALASAPQGGSRHGVSRAEARAYSADLRTSARHASDERPGASREGIVAKHVTEEEALGLNRKHRTRGLPPGPSTSRRRRPGPSSLPGRTSPRTRRGPTPRDRSLTEEESLRYRDTSARDSGRRPRRLRGRVLSEPAGRRPPPRARPAAYVPVVKRARFPAGWSSGWRTRIPNIGLPERPDPPVRRQERRSAAGGATSWSSWSPVPSAGGGGPLRRRGPDRRTPCAPNFSRTTRDPSRAAWARRYGWSTGSKVLTLTFDRYVPPADRLNKILRRLESPGILALNGDDTAERYGQPTVRPGGPPRRVSARTRPCPIPPSPRSRILRDRTSVPAHPVDPGDPGPEVRTVQQVGLHQGAGAPCRSPGPGPAGRP